MGYACPGRPALAAELAWRDASWTHRRTGIYGEMYVAAVIALVAFGIGSLAIAIGIPFWIAVIITVVIAAVVGGLYMFSDVFRTKANTQLTQWTEWTPENIAADPVNYLNFAEEQAKATLTKLEAAQTYARENGLTVPRHTLVARSKGFAASVEGLRRHIAAVYDLTIAYEKGVPSLWQYIKGSVSRIHLHVRRFPVDELPTLEEDVRQWLMDRWVEKDKLLRKALGDHIFEHFLHNKRTEWAEYIKEIHDWELVRYLDRY